MLNFEPLISFSRARLALRAPSVRVKTMGAETVAKSCAFCGIDVSGKPRTKDAQGRYACADCVKKATAVKARADAAAKGIDIAKANTPPNKLIEVQKTEDVTDVLDGLIAKSAAQSGTACPQCGRLIPTNGVLCTGCGFNKDTGKALRTRVERAPKELTGAAKVAKQTASAGMYLGFSVVGGLLGGAIGAAAWAFIAYQFKVEIGWIAWIIGAMVGIGASVGAQGMAGMMTGAYAAAVAAGSVLAGKYFAGLSLLDDFGLADAPVDVWYPKLFSLFDAIFIPLAIITAFRAGSMNVRDMGGGRR